MEVLSERCTAALMGRDLSVTGGLSPTANPFLAYPGLRSSGYTHEDAVNALRDYTELLADAQLTSLQGSEPADAVLNNAADYGRYWWLMAEVVVPLDEPFLLKYEERDALRLKAPFDRLRIDVVIADCGSNHVSLRVLDANVHLIRPRACEPGRRTTTRFITTSEQTKELHSFYAWDDDRPERVDLRARLAVLPRVRVTALVLSFLLYAVAGLLVGRAPATLSELALSVAPAGLAAGLLLTREPSSLGSRLRRGSTGFVLLGLAVLLAVAAWRAGSVLDAPAVASDTGAPSQEVPRGDEHR